MHDLKKCEKPSCILVDKVPSIQARNTNQTDNFWWSASALADHRKLYICLMPEMHRNVRHCIDMRFDAFHTIPAIIFGKK